MYILYLGQGYSKVSTQLALCTSFGNPACGSKLRFPFRSSTTGVKLTDVGYRVDILVHGALVIEVKALEAIAPVHLAQMVSYLKLADLKLGYLLNFNVEQMRGGIYRRVNGLGR